MKEPSAEPDKEKPQFGLRNDIYAKKMVRIVFLWGRRLRKDRLKYTYTYITEVSIKWHIAYLHVMYRCLK